MATILMLNGPNLGLLGLREPAIYGHDTLEDVEAACRDALQGTGHELDAFQTDHEGAMLERVHAARQDADAVVINAGAWTHTSIALLDALSAFEGPVVEVHISQVHRREAFRHHSYVSARADAVIVGCGVQGYEFAVLRVARLLD
ncbi:3-dehydroquinate dehydratase [Hasllibacter halocynthiae]|uniref:3-dehydroquinate dehydratase n=1 Tax=Hasllibacter halocynthiae TaxID=595589 RepID=A0A2T0X6N8_9RHOB|nr:type II 3-dehydroquinate dehydratase [Hasllibacter halocynthiae]PRY94534.1 3-dehydroquinate dehydratase [Hasllibacter halocynthiae]